VTTVAYKPGRTATQTWRDIASCLGHDPELWFPYSYTNAHGMRQANTAKAICLSCPVRRECLEDALQSEGGSKTDGRDGIRGGLTPEERYNVYRVRYRLARAVA
jgi:hypothetical protein